MLTLLLVILALLGGFALGFWCALCAVKKEYPMAWKLLILEMQAKQQKRADAARDKEA